MGAVDLYHGMQDGMRDYFRDGLHFSRDGNKRAFELIMEAVSALPGMDTSSRCPAERPRRCAGPRSV